MEAEEQYTEPVSICNLQDLKENAMSKFQFNEDTSVLVIKKQGQVYAIGNKCTHYGAPLNTGVLGNEFVRCPWHGACFNIKTGDIEDFPGLDSLPCYKVDIKEDGEIFIRARTKDLITGKRLRNMAKRDLNNPKVFVVVGGGPSGAVCVETLRQQGFTGRIVLLCRENHLPYDRIKISKSLNIHYQDIRYRAPEFYEEYGIETWLGVEATKLDSVEKVVYCSNNESIKFDKIYIATGGTPFRPPMIGGNYNRSFTVRDFADARRINECVTPDSKVVILGSSFIALESAAYFVKKVKSVTIIARQIPLLSNVFGYDVGAVISKLFEDNGVIIIPNNSIVECIADWDANVSSVKLTDGSEVPCNILILATGVTPNTGFMAKSGININKNGSIDTDDYLMTNVPGIYVGGDIANAPICAVGTERATIGHIQLAQCHGRIAAINMVKDNTKVLKTVPFFFTMLFGKGLRYSGYGGNYDDTSIDGDFKNFKFVIYFIRGDYVAAVGTCGRDPIAAKFAELTAQGKRIHKSEVKYTEDKIAWLSKLNEL